MVLHDFVNARAGEDLRSLLWRLLRESRIPF
jgi:hypothetical protein